MAPPPNLDIEQPAALVAHLRLRGLIAADETPVCRTLAGGVSNRTVWVGRPNGEAWVLKQALAKLRVKEDWFADPARIRREALGLRWLGQLVPAGAVPQFLFEDEAVHLLGMRAVPEPHENWKSRLLRMDVRPGDVGQFGELLGTIHRRSRERRAEVEPVFADASFFETLRLEPYYRFAANRNPAAREFFLQLIADTGANRSALVHGDYSPKNILVEGDRLILLDHEVIHWGDPAFDVGFGLTHLLSKANHLSQARSRFLEAAVGFWQSYRDAADMGAQRPGFEARAVRHTLACLLARVDGRSPLEYLDAEARDRQRAAVLRAIPVPPPTVDALIARHAEPA